jgi:hypothetical protein
MKHFIFEERDYEIDPRFRSPVKREKSRSSLRTLRRIMGGGRSGRRGGGRGGCRRVKDIRQNCVVKTHYSRSLEAHKAQIFSYLRREGTGKQGERAELYGTPPDEYIRNMDAKNFRIFLSPQSRDVKLRTLTESFVKRLELQTGYKFYWRAAEHYNTAHPHAHIIINGVDKEGKEVTIPPDIVKTYMRESAKDLCTAMIGSRTRAELKADKEKQAYAGRWTKLDEKLKDIIIGNKIYLEYADRCDKKNLFINRIGHLQSFGLCEWNKDHYGVKENWEEELRIQGRYNRYLDARRELKYTNKLNMTLYEPAKHGTISGRVTKIYKTDDVSDNHAILLEGIDGKAYFVPLFKKPEGVKEKDAVSVKAWRPPDKDESAEGAAGKTKKSRLLPVINQRTMGSLEREIKREGYKNLLADTVIKIANGERNIFPKGAGYEK